MIRKLTIVFFILINTCHILFGQKKIEINVGAGLVLHPILCDTYTKYDSTRSGTLYGNNERVSF